MRRIFDNPVLFQWWGVTWRLGNFSIVGGIALCLLAVLLGVVLFRHVGARARRLTPYEAGHVMFDQFHQHHMLDNATGAGIDFSMDIPKYRAAAREGDWSKFWLSPVTFTLGWAGIWMILVGAVASLKARDASVVLVIVSVFVALVLLLIWFMPFAALYTKIDIHAPSTEQGSKSKAPLP